MISGLSAGAVWSLKRLGSEQRVYGGAEDVRERGRVAVLSLAGRPSSREAPRTLGVWLKHLLPPVGGS